MRRLVTKAGLAWLRASAAEVHSRDSHNAYVVHMYEHVHVYAEVHSRDSHNAYVVHMYEHVHVYAEVHSRGSHSAYVSAYV